MTQEEHDLTAAEQQCRLVADALCARHQWLLLPPLEFARRAARHLVAGDAANAARAVTHAYCLELYSACSGQQGRERQSQGYTELFGYLYTTARAYYPERAAEIAQDAIEHVFLGFQSYRQPGAFLAIALQQLRDAARRLRRQEQRWQWLAQPLAGELGGQLVDLRQTDPVAPAIARELRESCTQILEAFAQKHRRSRRQLAALRMKYLEGLDDQTISRRLGVPLKSVYELRSRAIAKLRGDPQLRALAIDLGIVAEER